MSVYLTMTFFLSLGLNPKSPPPRPVVRFCLYPFVCTRRLGTPTAVTVARTVYKGEKSTWPIRSMQIIRSRVAPNGVRDKFLFRTCPEETIHRMSGSSEVRDSSVTTTTSTAHFHTCVHAHFVRRGRRRYWVYGFPRRALWFRVSKTIDNGHDAARPTRSTEYTVACKVRINRAFSTHLCFSSVRYCERTDCTEHRNKKLKTPSATRRN